MYLYIIFFIVIIFYIRSYNKEGFCYELGVSSNKYSYLTTFKSQIYNERYGKSLDNFNSDSDIIYNYTTILQDKNELIEKKIINSKKDMIDIENRLNYIKYSPEDKTNKLKEISIKKLFS